VKAEILLADYCRIVLGQDFDFLSALIRQNHGGGIGCCRYYYAAASFDVPFGRRRQTSLVLSSASPRLFQKGFNIDLFA
jgi:hypothetical protein